MKLSNFLKSAQRQFLKSLSSFLPSQSIASSKRKWDKLARQNAKYHVVSRKGRQISEDDFKETGLENYKEHIEEDAFLKEYLKGFQDKNILNIGCGVGRLEEFIAPNFSQVYGVDISEAMLEQASKRLANFDNVKLQATDGVSLPFKEDFFDFVFSYLVFQHMPSKKVVAQNFKEIHRALKPGGVAKIQVRGGHQPYKWQWFYGPAFSDKELRKMLENLNFQVLKTKDEDKKRFWVWLKKK